MIDALSVTQLNRYIAFKIKEDPKIHGILVKGEISNFKNAGHLYFTVKDTESLIRAVMFKSNASMLKFIPENGMNVIIMGSVSVYERDGVYQLYVTDMFPDGTGDQHYLFEKLKAKLSKEGIFDEEHKLKIPDFPEKIGVVTSSKGAALHDIISVIERRYPLCELRIYHSAVQGDQAPSELCDGLKSAEKDMCDVVIIGRGGGSYEDLAAFNDENLAYCIYNLTVPVISAVGHETDFTIADFAADLRAPTPSAAAERAVPSAEMLKKRISDLENRIKSSFELDLRRKQELLNSLDTRLLKKSPLNVCEKYISDVNSYSERIGRSYANLVAGKEALFVGLLSELSALDPMKVLCRGYSVVYDTDKRIIKSVGQISKDQQIRIKFTDGLADAVIKETEKC